MGTMRTMLLAAVALPALLLGFSTDANSCSCRGACGGAATYCSVMAVRVAQGCRTVCDDLFAGDFAARRDCRLLCRDQVVADKAACAAGRASCHALCDATADRRCADTVCGPALEDCRMAVTQATRDCIAAAGDDGVAVQACVEPGDAMLGIGRAALDLCLTDPVEGLAVCLAGC